MYNIVLVLGAQQNDSVIYMYILFKIFLSYRK